jgi:hypothetical protein
MAKPNDPKTLVTPKFRVSFPHLFEKEKYEDGKPKFNVTMLFPKDTDLEPLKKAALLAKEEKWGKKKVKGLKSPFKDGDAVDEDGDPVFAYDGYEGAIALRASTEYESLEIVDRQRQFITDPGEVYAGCYGRALVKACAYETPVSRGITFALVHFQKLDEGEPFGGERVSAHDAFDDDVSEETESGEAFKDDGGLDFGI